MRRHSNESTGPPIFLRGRSRGPFVRGLEVAAGVAAALYLSLLVAGLLGASWVPSLSLPGVGEVFPQGNQELRTPELAQGLETNQAGQEVEVPSADISLPRPASAPGTLAGGRPGDGQAPDAPSKTAPGKGAPTGRGEPADPAEPGQPDGSAQPAEPAAPAAEQGSTRGNSSETPRATPEPEPQGQGADQAADPEERSSGRSQRDEH